MKVSEAGNVIIPAYLTLQDKGYAVERISTKSDGSVTIWRATQDGNEFNASDPLALLGVVALAEYRGENWRAEPEEAKPFIREYLDESI